MEIDKRLIEKLIETTEKNTSEISSIRASVSAKSTFDTYNMLKKEYLDLKYRVVKEDSISLEEKLERLEFLEEDCRRLITSPTTHCSGKDYNEYFKLFGDLLSKVLELKKSVKIGTMHTMLRENSSLISQIH